GPPRGGGPPAAHPRLAQPRPDSERERDPLQPRRPHRRPLSPPTPTPPVMRLSITCLLAALGLLLTVTPARAQLNYSATANCSSTPTGHVEWPVDNPVWTFDYTRPSHSAGIDGSGLELHNVHYRGYLILRRAHT